MVAARTPKEHRIKSANRIVALDQRPSRLKPREDLLMVRVDFSKVPLPVCFCGHSDKEHPDRLGRCGRELCCCAAYKPFVEEVNDPKFSVEH